MSDLLSFGVISELLEIFRLCKWCGLCVLLSYYGQSKMRSRTAEIAFEWTG